MNDKIFRRIIAAVTALGIVTTAALVIYTIYLHDHCSIIAFIANGG